MPRIARMIVQGEVVVYHVISRTVLDGYVIGDAEKEYLLNLIKRISSVYFTEVLGFCLMGDHFHLVVRMHRGEDYSDEEIKRRLNLYYGDKERALHEGQISSLREKWANLSEYIKEIKQGFSRFYNKRHNRRGFFWSERFKSVIVDNGETLINCLAYVDLNPVRAGICETPEAYRWSSLGYHIHTNNKDDFLSLDFGLWELGIMDGPLNAYLGFVYEKGGITSHEKDMAEGLETNSLDRFMYKSRYFSDSGIIGTKAFVSRHYQTFKHHFSSRHQKTPKAIKGLDSIYSLKRLSESGQPD